MREKPISLYPLTVEEALRKAMVAKIDKPDTLLEQEQYRDDGCEVSPHCLSCPLPSCKFDTPGLLARQRREERYANIRRARIENPTMSVPKLARLCGVSSRQVFRVLAGDKRRAT